MAELQGILLCSGGGSRLSPLTDDVPKCLLPVVGVPMFLYPLSSLIRSGVKEVKIFVRESVKKSLSVALDESGLLSSSRISVDYICIGRDQEDFGTAELLRSHASKITKDCLIVSCDFVSDASLTPLIDIFRAQRATVVGLVSDNCSTGPVPGPKSKKSKATDLIALDEKTGQLAFLSADDDFDGIVQSERWTEKLPKLSLTSRFNDCHVYALRHSALQLLQKQKNIVSIKADFVPYLIEKQFEDTSDISCFVYRLPHENGFVTAHANSIGPYFEVNKTVLKSFSRLMPNQSSGKLIRSADRNSAHEFRVEQDVEVGEKIFIKRSVVGSKCSLGERSKLKESLLLKNVKIGNGASVTNSILCDGVEIGENADVTNCIVCRGQKIGAKAKVQNEVVRDNDSEEWADS